MALPQQPSKLWVAGSSPAGRIDIKDLGGPKGPLSLITRAYRGESAYILLTAGLMAALLMGCASDPDETVNDCAAEMEATVAEHGAAEETVTLSLGADTHVQQWWYYSLGFARTFAWGDDLPACAVDGQTFEPTPAP